MDILFFALIAFFTIYKLYSVLGQDDQEANLRGNMYDLKDITSAATEDVKPQLEIYTTSKFANIFTTINSYDINFSEEKFIKGAKKAFEMIINGFCVKDKELLKLLLSDKTYQYFLEQIEAAEKSGHNFEKIIVSIKSIEISDAKIDGKIANIILEISSDQINIIRDKEGNIIKGNPEHIEHVKDIWGFSKDISSSNPNWVISSIS